MSRNAFDPVDAAVLAQFLRECEPPTPPSRSDASPNVFLSSELVQPPQAPSKTFTGSLLKLDEEDKQAILAALDDYSELSNSSVYIENAQCLKRDQEVKAEEAKMLKLTLQRAKATKRRNRHRQRVKEEWQALRLQSSQLSAKLEALRRSRINTVAGASQLKWQTLASNELDARLQAEGQQKCIRVAIERRAGVMQKLQGMLNTHQCSNRPMKTEEVSPEWQPDDFKVYENFEFELAAAYARTDAVLHECGLTGVVPCNSSLYKPIERWDAVRNITYFESTSAFIMPSKYPNSASAMFDAMRQVHRQQILFETAENLPNTIAVKFGTVYHCEEERIVPLTLITVLRRIVEPGRTVLVWRCLIEGGGEFSGTCLDETGWCVLRHLVHAILPMFEPAYTRFPYVEVSKR